MMWKSIIEQLYANQTVSTAVAKQATLYLLPLI
jgi:hypothetical protein